MSSIITHLHEVVKEVEPTEEEWMKAIMFLTKTGHMSDDRRQEFILLSDVLGVSMLLDAINKLVKYNIGAIPVINNNKKLVGIISERDIVKALSNYKNKDYSILLVNQLMTKTVISCEKEVLSDELMELMTINKIRHIPIVENNAPIGIVSIGDVVNRLIEKVQYENKMLKDFVSG